MMMVSSCNAMGLPMRALTISILRLFACYLPSSGSAANSADSRDYSQAHLQAISQQA